MMLHIILAILEMIMPVLLIQFLHKEMAELKYLSNKLKMFLIQVFRR